MVRGIGESARAKLPRLLNFTKIIPPFLPALPKGQPAAKDNGLRILGVPVRRTW